MSLQQIREAFCRCLPADARSVALGRGLMLIRECSISDLVNEVDTAVVEVVGRETTGP